MKLLNTDNIMQSEPPKGVVHKQNYLSLKKFSFIALGIILFLSMSMVVIAYLKVTSFQSLLTQTTLQSMPKVMMYAKMYRQVNELTYATVALTTVNTQDQRRIAYGILQEKISTIPQLIAKTAVQSDSLIQLDIIQQEINGLNVLIKQRLEIQKQHNDHQQKIYAIYEKVNAINTYERDKFLQTTSSAILIAEQAISYKTLNEIQKNANIVKSLFDELLKIKSLKPNQIQLITTLKDLLIGENGILPLHIKQLKIFGRTRGRAEFVRNLVIDYARLAEYDSFRYNKRIITETTQFSSTVAQQVKLLGVIAIVVILLIIMITFFIQHRLINRLVLLNNRIRNRLAGEPYTFKIGGNDEITDIARSFNLFNKTIETQQEALIKTSLTDSLTNIPNRRGLDKKFDHLLLSAQRHQWPIAVLMMDVDNFKTYNDFYGHVAGDECLQKVAEVLKTVLRRPEDFVARYGGEEFVFILPDTPVEGAKVIAQEVINSLKNSAIPHQKSDVASYVTLSIGISISQNNSTRSELLEHADNALYSAKKAGKNQFIVYI